MLALLLALTTAVAAENQKPGTADWEISNPALHQEIEGYASRTSVNAGDPIDLLVSTRAARYAIDETKARAPIWKRATDQSSDGSATSIR